MIHLKYKCKFYCVKLPLIRTDLCLKLVFENATAGRKTGCRSVVNFAITADSFRCGLRLWKCDQTSISRYHLNTVNQFFHSFPHTRIQLAEVWRPGWHVLLMICNRQNPGPSTSGISHNKFSKMPPPTSTNLSTRYRVLRVARRSSWRRSFIRTQTLLMRAARSARVSTLVRYSHPHKQKSKGVKSRERAGQWIRLPRPIHRLGYVLFRCWITFLGVMDWCSIVL